MTCEGWLAPAVERLRSVAGEGLFAVGGQLWVCHRGRVACDVAVGDAAGGPMTTGTVHHHYCMGKPILAVTVGLLVADGRIDPTAPLRSFDIPEWAVPRFDCSVLDLLDHQAGLDTLAAMEYRITPVEDRPRLVADRIAAARPSPAYSEILAGIILEQVIQAATGDTAVAAVGSLLDGIGLHETALDPHRALRLSQRGVVSTPVAGLPTRRVPLLFELLERSLADLRPAFDLLSSARDLGRLLEACRSALQDGPDGPGPLRQAMATLLAPRHGPFDDRRTLRRMRMAGGFMIDATANGLARLAPENSFGHNAGMAQSVAVADLDHRLVISLYLNGAEVGAPVTRLDRLAVVDDVYRGLAECTEAPR